MFAILGLLCWTNILRQNVKLNLWNNSDLHSATGGSSVESKQSQFPENEWYNGSLPDSYAERSEINGPVAVKVEVRISKNIDVSSGQGMLIDVAEIIIDFDQNLFIDDLINSQPIDIFTEILGDGNMQPKSLMYSKNIVHLVCGEKTFFPNTYDTLQNNDGPNMDGIYVSGSVTSPFSSFFLAMNQNAIKEPSIPNRFTSLLVLKFNGEENVVDFSACKMRFNNPNSPFNLIQNLQPRYVNLQHFVVNKDGTPITKDVDLVAGSQPLCSSTDFDRYYNLVLEVMEKFDSLELTQYDFSRISSIFRGLTFNVAYTSCVNFVGNLYTQKDEVLEVMTGASCQYNIGAPEYKSDPCCSQEASLTQCCAPKMRSVLFPVIGQIKEDLLSQCQYPEKVESLIISTLESLRQQKIQESSADPGAAFELYTAFFQSCSDKVYNQDCLTNSQCMSGYCSDQNRKCMVPWGQDSALLLQCYLKEMKPELFYQLKSDLKLPFSSSANENDLESIKRSIELKLSDFDCVGNTAWQSQGGKQCSWQKNQDGYYEQICIPANEEKCLAKKICNIKAYQETTEQQCNAIKEREPSFCARCDSGYCYNVGYPSKCQAWTQSEPVCSSGGGYFQTYTYSWGNYSECTFPNAKTSDQCYSGKYCTSGNCNTFAYTSDTDPDICNERNQYRDPNNDTAPWFYWGQALNDSYCGVYYSLNVSNYNEAYLEYSIKDGFNLALGRNYQNGYLDSSDTCSSGFCDNRRIFTNNSTECEDSGYCSRGCSKCLSSNWDAQKQSACLINSNHTTCLSLSGDFQNGTCILHGSTTAACDINNGTFATCSSYSHDNCGKDDRTSFMSCEWNPWADCATDEECKESGECDDYEYQADCEWNNSCTFENDGVCVTEFDYQNGYRSCPQNSSWSKLGCINKSTSRSDCNGTWKTRAKSSIECAAHGQGCFEKKNWFYSHKNSTECSKCNSNLENLYKWYPGFWKFGQIMAGNWKDVEYASENKFIEVISQERLKSAVENSAYVIVGSKLLNDIKQSLLVPLLAIKQIACSCTTNSNCFSNITIVPQKSCRADPGLASQCDVTLPPYFNSSIKVSIGLLSAGQYSSSNYVRSRFRLSKRLPASNYAVVRLGGATVGQLVGDGKSFSFESPVDSFVGCLDINQQIVLDARYTVYDAVFVLPNNTLGPPLHSTMILNGLQICGTFQSAGTYFPILRLINDQTENLQISSLLVGDYKTAGVDKSLSTITMWSASHTTSTYDVSHSLSVNTLKSLESQSSNGNFATYIYCFVIMITFM
eukprot:NODE_56_length_25944_cov_0.235287.p1 type:complete len:1283 gc:universal NODE_56_length_25944_cov_0.235287:12495-8647(-)